MKARLNILGRKLKVISIDFLNDEVDAVLTVDDNGNYNSYYNEKTMKSRGNVLFANMEEWLEFPDLEQRIVDERNKLIEHLEKLAAREDDELTGIAIDAMEGSSLPFGELALIESQKEYKLMQQRVLGIIDAMEEVKAFMEGYYANVDDEAAEEEGYHQSIE